MDSSELLALEASAHLLHFTNWILRIETSVNHIRGSDCRRHKSTSSYIILCWVAGLSFNPKVSDEHMGIVKRLINFKQNELSLYVHTHAHGVFIRKTISWLPVAWISWGSLNMQCTSRWLTNQAKFSTESQLTSDNVSLWPVLPSPRDNVRLQALSPHWPAGPLSTPLALSCLCFEPGAPWLTVNSWSRF